MQLYNLERNKNITYGKDISFFFFAFFKITGFVLGALAFSFNGNSPGYSEFGSQYHMLDGYKITFTIPFDGDKDLLDLRPSTFYRQSFPVDRVQTVIIASHFLIYRFYCLKICIYFTLKPLLNNLITILTSLQFK